ncbi:tyrosine-type recombinase/integrase [Amphritea sp. HPY]|uniref:tyrosine-type recombinase/integrase n=1 Tax=Amphritea sp. HPY TaxID=3421652 RepID=UPI003D7D3F04
MDKLTSMTISDEHLVSGKYVKEHLKLSQSLFNAYLVRDVDVLESSPTEGLRWEHDDNRYASLTDAQVRSVLQKVANKPEWFRWFMLIAIYSGARRSEIASLRPCDFKQCEDTGRYYFVISEGKTKAARRMVPVHKSLEEAGLLEWIGNGQRLIFPIVAKNPSRVTDSFNRLLDDRFNDLGERIVFHSTRHTFITKARAAGMTNVLVQQVIGHEKTGAGMTDRYTHTFQLKDVLQVVDAVDYGELTTEQ